MATTMVKRTDQISEIVLGNFGARVNLRGYDGVEKDPVLNTTTATGVYGLIEQTTHGKHIAVPLAATSVTAAPTPANSVLLVDDAGVAVGVGKYLRLYDTVGTDFAQLTSDASGGLVLGGSGANAGQFSITDLIVTDDLTVGDDLITPTIGPDADSQHALQNVAPGTLALLGVANAGGHLLFIDNSYDIGASGATRPRDLFLARNATIGGALGAQATTVTTLTASSTVQGTRLISTVATGTAPLTVSSTTNIPNLNASLLNDKLDTAFAQLGATSNFTTPPTINSDAVAITISGSYTGNGGGSQTISGLGFTPTRVFIQMLNSNTDACVAELTTAGTFTTKLSGITISAIADLTVGISGATFVAGLAAGTNDNTKTYRYTAIGS